MNFDPWRVYHIHSSTTVPPKTKYAVCFDIGPPTLFFFINTTPRIHGCGQFPVFAGEHSVLTHDSFIDLATFIIPPINDLQSATPKEELSKSILDRIKPQILLGNDMLPERYRVKALESLVNLK